MKKTLILVVAMLAPWVAYPASSSQPPTRPAAVELRPHPPFPVVFGGWGGSWSPDGLHLVFALPAGTALEILDLPRMCRWELLPAGKDPVWSPDGRLIAYVTEPSVNEYQQEAVCVIQPDGQGQRRLCQGGYPRWSADGKKLFFHNRGSESVLSVKVDEPEPKPELFFTNALSWYPAVSPDEKRIAFGAAQALKIIDVQTGEVVREWPTPGERGLLPSWSPDGRFVTFGGFDGSALGVWALDVQTGKAAQLLAGGFTLPVWSADGERLCFDYRQGNERVLFIVGRPYVEARVEDRVPLFAPY